MPKYLQILKPFEREFIVKHGSSEDERFQMVAQHLINNSLMYNIEEAKMWKNILLEYAPTQELKEYVEALI